MQWSKNYCAVEQLIKIDSWKMTSRVAEIISTHLISLSLFGLLFE